jgi:hypothetical protein
MKTLRFGGTHVKEFSIVEEQPGLEDSDAFEVQWLECVFPRCDVDEIKSSIDNIKHKWRKEIIKKADNPFSQVLKKLLQFWLIFRTGY